MRTHIIAPEDLVDSVDKLVGSRGRSRFFVEAVEEKLSKIRRVRLGKKLAGSLANTSIPEWNTSKEAIDWVRNSRKADERRLTHMLRTK